MKEEKGKILNNFNKLGIIFIVGFIFAYRWYLIGNYGDWADLAGQFLFGCVLGAAALWGLEKGLNYKKKK